MIFFSQNEKFIPITMGFIIFAIAFSMWEFHQIAHAVDIKPAARLTISVGVLYALSVGLSTQYPSLALLPQMTLLTSLVAFFAYYFRKGDTPFVSIAANLFSFVYLAVPLSCMLGITYFFPNNALQDNRWWIAYLLIVTKTTDTAAFIIGRKYGKQKMAPYISPNKTWEGAFGGLLFAIGISFIMTAFAKIIHARFDLTLWESLWVGALMGLLAELGDLAESLLKRDGGIKDSNRMLPGLGGVLDIVDSLVFTAPFLYIFLKATHLQ